MSPGPRAALLTCLLLIGMRLAALPPATLRVPRVSRAPRLDDFPTPVLHESEARISDFRQREPGDGIPASHQTVAYLSYDNENLYVVFVCADDPAGIRARLSRREDIDSDDRVGIYLDTFHDRQRYYVFAVNPRGVQMDGIATEGQGTDISFDTLWYSNARLTDDGFVVWMAIPFKSLRFPDAPAQTWGFALFRTIQRNSETSFWPYLTQRVESTARQFADLEGLEEISPGNNVQFIPYFVGSASRYLDPLSPGASAFRTQTEFRPGLDAKLVLRDAVTFDVALNPDFSQVESDDPQVTVNQRYEVLFPEKRPFFIENAGYFQTPISLFFSRRIADPQFGVRMTGKVGHWALGVLAMDDRAEGKQLPYDDPLRKERAADAVVRIQRDLANQSTVGFLAASSDFGLGSNRVFSFDTRIKLNPNWVLTAEAAGSYTRTSEGMRTAGGAYWAELSHTGRHAVYAARYLDYGPNFDAQLGFIPRVDIRKAEQYFRYYWKPKKGPVLLFGPDITASVDWNYHGDLQDWVTDMSFGGNLRGPTGAGCRHVNAYELYLGLGFRHHYTDCGVNSRWLRWLELTPDYGWGTVINYYPSQGMLPFLGTGNSVSFSAILRPSSNVSFTPTYLYTRVATAAAIGTFGRGTVVFNDQVVRSKLNVQITRALSVRAIVDYHGVLPNPLLASQQHTCVNCTGYSSTKRVTADFLLTYLLHPGTAVYVGYTERRENPFSPAQATPPLRPSALDVCTGWQVFAKVSYLLRR